MNRFTQPKWLAQIISLMVLGGVAAVYFLVYVPRQRDYFASRNFRVLGLTSEQIQKTIEAFPRVLEIAAKSVESEHVPADPTRVENAMKLVPALSLTAATVESITNSATNLNTTFRLNGSWLVLEYRSYAGTNKSRVVTIQAKCDLSRLALVPQEFDGLLIAQESGEVLFQRLPLGLNVQTLNKPDRDAQNTSGTNLLRRASSVVTARLAEHDYKFFVQPLQLAVPMQSTNANNWLVCGVVRAGRFNSESLEVSYFFLIMCIFLVLFALVSLVFPRVAFAGPREPLRRRTVFLLIAGNLGGAALLTILLLDVMVYPFAGATFDRTSERLAGMIRTNFDKEIKALHQVVTDFDRLRATNSFPGTNILTEALTRHEVTNVVGSRVKFDMVFWTGDDGIQTHKWAVRRTATSLINVWERPYVQDALDDRNTVRAYREKGTNEFWVEPIYSLSTGENSVILAVRSSLGGVAAIETPLQTLLRPVLPTGHGFAVIAADGLVLFHSEVRRNLRENLFEECDDSTRLRSVVFSRTTQQFNLNYLGRSHSFFVTPMENLPWTLVVFRDRQLWSAANFELVLLSLFLLAICFVAPLALIVLTLGVPWLLRSAIGTQASVSVLPRWLWPDPRRWKDYLFLGAFNLALALCLVSLVTFLLPDHGSASWAWCVAAVSITGALVGIVTSFSVLTCRAPGAAPTGRCGKLYPWLYVAVLISLLLLVAVVPAFASFNVALDMRIHLFVKHGQFSFANALAERADRSKRAHRQIPGAEALRTALDLNPENLPWDVYAGTSLRLLPEDAGGTSIRRPKKLRIESAPFDWLFEKIAPLRDPVSVETRGLLAKQSQDNFWSWDHYPERVTLRVNNYREGASLSLTTPKIAIPIYTWLFTLAATSLILLFPTCFVAHRVFLIHLPRNTSAREALGAESIPGHLLVLGEPPAREKWLLDQIGADVAKKRRDDTLQVDCRKESFDAPAHYRPPQPHVILEHFEHGWDDPSMGRRKLQLLDKLMSRSGWSVIVSSARDPRYFKLEGPADQPGQDGAKRDSRRWTQIWHDFRWISLHAADEEQTGYRAIWAECSKDEQLALYHVAKHGLLHANNPELPILLGRGLLINDRGLKLMSPGFHRFVCETIDPEEVRTYDEEVASKGWDIVKGPVYVALMGVALLMFATQPEIYKSVFGIITAFTAGPPAILKLLSLFESAKSKKAEA